MSENLHTGISTHAVNPTPFFTQALLESCDPALLQTLPGCGFHEARLGARAMSDFKGRHFEGEIVLWAVRWYCRYGVSDRDLEQVGPQGGLTGERGILVDHSTTYRWVQRYAPEMEKRLR